MSSTKIKVPRTPLEIEGAALLEDVKGAKGLAATRELFDFVITRTTRVTAHGRTRRRIKNLPGASAVDTRGLSGVSPAKLRTAEVELLRPLREKIIDFIARAMGAIYADTVPAEHRHELAERVVREIWPQIGTLPDDDKLEHFVESWARASRLTARGQLGDGPVE